MNLFEQTLQNIAVQARSEQEIESLAAQINGLDDLINVVSQSKKVGSGILKNGYYEGFVRDTENVINKALKDAKTTGVDIPKTLQNYMRMRDENAVFDNIRHMKNDIKGSIFQGITM